MQDECVTALAVLPSGDLVSGDVDGTIRIWDTNSGKVKQTISRTVH